MGEVLLDVVGIAQGSRVLDVASGTGVVAGIAVWAGGHPLEPFGVYGDELAAIGAEEHPSDRSSMRCRVISETGLKLGSRSGSSRRSLAPSSAGGPLQYSPGQRSSEPAFFANSATFVQAGLNKSGGVGVERPGWSPRPEG